jgi:hypothetical protein
MKYKYLHFTHILLWLILLSSCSQTNPTLNKESLLHHYTLSEDSLKRQAIAFILDNIDIHTSDIPAFVDKLTGEKVVLDLSTIENDSILTEIIGRLNLTPMFATVPDIHLIDNTFLIADIGLAFDLWNKYPWADQVPFDVFLNYLFPYKIYKEEAADWRSFFVEKYRDSLNNMLMSLEMDALRCTNEIYYRILVKDVGQWFEYEANPPRLTRHPGFRELMALKTSECYGWSYLNVMVLRSLGIPSTIDFVPAWGRKNAGHASEVFWDNERQRFTTPPGRRFEFPTKVFRYAFKQQSIWTDSIQPVIQQNIFLLDFLKNDLWLDVTHEHTPTATIDYECEQILSDFAYICVFNYGRWIPAYWGRTTNGKARFENMGTEMLYRIAIPQGDSFEVISPVFHVAENGSKTFFKPNQEKKMTLRLSKLNTGGRSWVEKGKNYSLYYYDKNNNWTLFQTQQCENDSLIVFEGIPTNTLYLLRDDEQRRRLERIFTYENGEQIFW